MSNNDAPESPDFLVSPNKKGKGVRRLNKVPLIVLGALISLAVIGITYTFYQRQALNNRPVSVVQNKPVPKMAVPPIRPPGLDYVQPSTEPAIATQNAIPGTVAAANPIAVQQAAMTAPRDERYEARLRLLDRIEEQKLARLEAALGSEADVQAFAQRDQKLGSGAISQSPAIITAGGRVDGAQLAQQLLSNMQGSDMSGTGMGQNSSDPNRQSGKKAFLAGTPDAEIYLSQTRVAGIALNSEIKAGTIIPGVMISGINSDLPGQIIGQVREDVYDSATGQNLLVPSGSKLIGTYDSTITMGQSRVLVAWTRIIYPDSSSVSLNLMPGADMSGYAGFNDKVNNHYWRVFGNAALLSVFSAGVQLSQPTKNTGDGYDSQQIIAAEIGRQLGQLGMEMTRRNMDIQPILEIRPGYNFNIMITKDIILPPWTGHPLAVGQ